MPLPFGVVFTWAPIPCHMADLLVLTVDAQVYRNVTTPPLNTPSAAVVREVLFQQLAATVLTTHGPFTIAANAVDFAIPSLPAAPYDGALIIVPDIQVRVNINSQGYQVISPGGFITMASTSTVLFKNDIIPPGQTIPVPTTQPCHVRYFAVKLT